MNKCKYVNYKNPYREGKHSFTITECVNVLFYYTVKFKFCPFCGKEIELIKETEVKSVNDIIVEE